MIEDNDLARGWVHYLLKKNIQNLLDTDNLLCSRKKYQGKRVVASLVGKNPLELFNSYVEIYKRNNDPALLKFSLTTEDILPKLQNWKEQNAFIYKRW